MPVRARAPCWLGALLAPLNLALTRWLTLQFNGFSAGLFLHQVFYPNPNPYPYPNSNPSPNPYPRKPLP